MGRRRAEPDRRRSRRTRGDRRQRPSRPGGRRRLVLLGLLAALVTVAVVAPALVPDRPRVRTSSPPASRSPETPIPQEPADVSDLPIGRAPFCARIDDSALDTALQGQVDRRTSYRPGDQVSLAPGSSDVADEFGCTFGSGDDEVRAWVFAAPMTSREARDVVAELRGREGCRYPGDALGFGTPGLTSICRVGDPAQVQVTSRGLFGTSWLSCQLTTSDTGDAARARANRWCLHVATTLGARP